MDPRRIELGAFAGVHLRVWPGANVAVFNALAKVIVEEGLFDTGYVAARCDGFDALRAFLGSLSLNDLSGKARVAPEQIRAAARLMASRGPGLFVSGLGLSEQTQGVGGVMAYANLALLTGAIGKRGSGMLPLRGQNNVQGNADMGAQPYAHTGYLKLDDPDAQRRLHTVWGTVPPVEAGKTIPEMYDAAVAGSFKALWIQGEDVVQSDPHTAHVRKALGGLDLLIVQELFMTETARLAHVVFPAASVLEQEGTFTNAERRIQHVRPAVAPPGRARPDWEVIRDVAAAMKPPAGPWTYRHPSEVMDEVARVAPHLFGGVAYDRLTPDGIQWPCPTREHPGTRTLHADVFDRGRAVLMSVDDAPSADATGTAYPFVLITGRVLDHYNVGTMTRRTPSERLVGRDFLEIHPEDAARLGIADGAEVRVTSRWGQAVAPARHSRRMLPGTLFLSFHFPETHTNCVVGPHVDPTSKCPDYKAVAVALSPG
jgi:formate dehydrogenase major subunit